MWIVRDRRRVRSAASVAVLVALGVVIPVTSSFGSSAGGNRVWARIEAGTRGRRHRGRPVRGIDAGMREGDTLARGRWLYGRAFAMSAEQGGTWDLRTAP